MLKKRWRFKKMKRQNGEGTWGTKKIKGILYKRYSVSYPEGRKDFYGKTKKEIDQKVQAYNKKRSPYVRPCTDSNLITFGQYSLDYIHTTYNYYIHISNQQLIEATTIFDHL